MRSLATLGITSSLGGSMHPTVSAAELLHDHFSLQNSKDLQLHWHMLHPQSQGSKQIKVYELCKKISAYTQYWTTSGCPFLVIGGDHSCALGTWSGVLMGLQQPDQFGLIWLDAHMDAHTFATSPSGNIHGMPLAALLGKGDTYLSRLYPASVYINPRRLILLGVRSFEQQEYDLLSAAHVEIVYADQLMQSNGIEKALLTAINKLSLSCRFIGISIDLDSVDPTDAPGVETPAINGIRAEELLAALAAIKHHPKISALEICEFNVDNDQHSKTLKLMQNIIETFYGDIIPNKSFGFSSSGTNGISVPT